MIKSLKYLSSKLSNCEYIGDDTIITGVHIDSRKITSGQLFVALKGARDGHDFIENAVENGAVAVLVMDKKEYLNIPQIIVKDTRKALFDLAHFYRNELNMPVLAITGSCGKTTTKDILVCMLRYFGNVHCSQESFNNALGVPITILSAPKDIDYLVIEVGTNSPGEISNLACLIQADFAGVTNISPSHLKNLHSLGGIMNEKGDLLKSIKSNGQIIVNLDDYRIKSFAKKLNRRNVTFSIKNSQADVYCSEKKLSNDILYFTLNTMGMPYNAKLNTIGIHNIQNVLMAVAFIKALKLNISKALQSLSTYVSREGRLFLYPLNYFISIIDDTYNASVSSVKAAIYSLDQFSGVKYLVLGNMDELGRYSKYYHSMIGQLIKTSNINYTYLYGNNCWTNCLRKQVSSNIQHFQNKSQLLKKLQTDINRNARKHSRILIKGSRSNKMEELIIMLKENITNLETKF